MKAKIFLSGGFRSGWQDVIKDRFKHKFTFFNPRNHNLEDSDLYTAWDIHFVKECDIVFAYMEESNPSGYGLAFELGIAYAMNKTIILVDEKSACNDTFSRYFKIVHRPSNVVFTKFEDGIDFLESFYIEE